MTTLGALFGATAVVHDVVDAARAAAVRERCEQRGYRRYALVDRGSYDVQANPDEPDLLAQLVRQAERATDRTLAVSETRVLRLGPGDYLLAHHDRIHDDNPVEVTLDLSPAPVADAEVHYRRRGQVYFRFECTPGALAIVERSVSVTCNHTYISKLHAGAHVVRLVALLRDVTG